MICLTCTHSIVRELVNGSMRDTLVSCDLDGWNVKPMGKCSRHSESFVQMIDPDHGTPVVERVPGIPTNYSTADLMEAERAGYIHRVVDKDEMEGLMLKEPKHKGWPKGKPRK